MVFEIRFARSESSRPKSERLGVSRRHRIASAYTHTHTPIPTHTLYYIHYNIISVHRFHLRDGFAVAAPFLSLARPPPLRAPHAASDVKARAGIKRVESHFCFLFVLLSLLSLYNIEKIIKNVTQNNIYYAVFHNNKIATTAANIPLGI